MAEPITLQKLIDASLDSDSLEVLVNGDENAQVTTRTGETYPSAAKTMRVLLEQGTLNAQPFTTQALMTASDLTNGSYALVTDDSVADRNGYYQKRAGAWVFLKYNPVGRNSPSLTGTPTAPTASVETTNTQIANTTFAFLMQHGQIIKSLSGDLTLTDGETRYPILVFTGSLTANTTVTIPSLGGPRSWTIRNATSGGYNLTLAGTSNSVLLPSGISKVYTNATSLFLAGADKASIESPVLTGKPRAPTADFEVTDNQIANTTYAFSMQHGQKVISLSGARTLTDGETRYPILVFTGSNSTVTVPTLTAARHWTVRNATSGPITLMATSNSVTLPLGISTVYCNGSALFLLASTANDTTAPTEPKPLTDLNATLTSKSPKNIVVSMSNDRTRGWGYASNTLDETTDDGLTWTNLYTFSGAAIEVVRELGDGELLIVTTDAETYRTVWKTQGYGTDTITMIECFKGHAPAVKFTSAWSVFIHDNIVLVNDYGPKAGYTWGGGSDVIAEGNNARYTYMSLDNGKTWQTIFDLNAWLTTNGYATTGCHLHGVAYDKWWDRLWVTFGDNAYGIGGTVFSDDLGETWHWANEGKADKDNPALAPEGSACQVVGILPMQDCILFGTDTAPNGILRIDRSQGKKLTKYKIEVGFKINDDVPSHLCQGIWQFSDDQPAFFAFSSEFKSSKSCIVATWDGETFKKVWEDSENNPSGMGLRSVVAPTIRGNLIAANNDLRVNGLWSEVKGKAPIYKV